MSGKEIASMPSRKGTLMEQKGRLNQREPLLRKGISAPSFCAIIGGGAIMRKGGLLSIEVHYCGGGRRNENNVRTEELACCSLAINVGSAEKGSKS